MDTDCHEPITAETTVAEALCRYPQCVHVFRRHGLNCCGCVNNSIETIASLSRLLQTPLHEILQELNVAGRTHGSNTARWQVIIQSEDE